MFTIDHVRSALSHCLKRERPGIALEFSGVTNDSRVAKPGELFVALTTEVRDGHDFISDAVAHGVSGVILHNAEIPLPDHLWAFVVDDTKHAIAAAARAAGARTVRHFDTKEEAVEVLRATLGPGDVLLVKASHGLALGAVVDELIG